MPTPCKYFINRIITGISVEMLFLLKGDGLKSHHHIDSRIVVGENGSEGQVSVFQVGSRE